MLRGLASHNEIRVLSKLLIGMKKIHDPQLPAQLSTSIKALAGTLRGNHLVAHPSELFSSLGPPVPR